MHWSLKDVGLNSVQKTHSCHYVPLCPSSETHLQESYQLATKNAAKTAERNKIKFDRHDTESSLDVGDRMLVRNVCLRGKHKLADKWEAVVHVVINQKEDLPVCTVKPENKDGPLRTLHQDLLLPCGFLLYQPLKKSLLLCQTNLEGQAHVSIQTLILVSKSQS